MAAIKRWILFGVVLACWMAAPVFGSESRTADIPQVPAPGLVTMVDLGAHECIPCKMMAPIISELQKEYAGRAAVVFIDVWENRDQIERFAIRGIPTQIFYDKEGREVSRHVGFLDKQSIIAAFEQLGVPKESVQ